jgi:hypothetical protein
LIVVVEEMRMEMLTTIMKYAAISVPPAGIFWHPTTNLRSYLDFVVAAASIFVLVQAINLRKYWWMAVFSAIFVLFNPILPIVFSFGTMVPLQIVTATVFAVSVQMLKTTHRLTVASITGDRTRTESL